MHTSAHYNVKLLNQSAVLMLYAHIISPKCGSALSTHSNDFIHRYIERMTSSKRKNCFGRGDSGVAGEKTILCERLTSVRIIQ